jgi:biotin carboxyl carrier protein
MSTANTFDSSSTSPSGRSRTGRVVALLFAVAAAAGAAVVLTRGNGDEATTAATIPLTKEVTVERGDLDVSESVDGSVEETDTVSVIHRIEGQQSVGATTGTPTNSSANSPTTGSTPQAANGSGAPTAAGLTALPASASIESLSLSMSLSVSLAPPVDTTVPVTSPPDTTTPDPAAPSTTSPSTPAPSTPSPSTPAPGGALPGGGGGAPTGGAPTAGTGTTGAAGSTGTVTQVITGVANVGDEIASGDVLYTVESSPVVALAGALPAWRTMNRSSADGLDIAQLEAALVALGYDPNGDVVVDQEWDSDTTAMVRRWQAGLRLDATGEVTLGSVVFIAHTGTVTGTSVSVGDEVQDGSSVLSLSGTVQQVIIEVPPELQSNVTPSMGVDIAGTPGTVQRLRSAVVTDAGVDSVTVQAVIVPDTPLTSPAGSVVKVTISYAVATDQLVVATEAIVSRLDGGYAVEVADADGGRSFVPVDVVAVSGNRTAITGEGITESMTVLAPA